MYLLHKSLYEFLGSDESRTGSSNGTTLQVDVREGHLFLANASRLYQKQQFNADGSTPALDMVMKQPQIGNLYGLRHVAAHACQACDSSVLNDVLLDLNLWESVYDTGGDT